MVLKVATSEAAILLELTGQAEHTPRSVSVGPQRVKKKKGPTSTKKNYTWKMVTIYYEYDCVRFK